MADIKLFSTAEGDWMALYVDGRKKFEGHSIDNYQWLELVGGKSWQDNDDLLGELDMWAFRFPESLNELEDYIKEREDEG